MFKDEYLKVEKLNATQQKLKCQFPDCQNGFCYGLKPKIFLQEALNKELRKIMRVCELHYLQLNEKN